MLPRSTGETSEEDDDFSEVELDLNEQRFINKHIKIPQRKYSHTVSFTNDEGQTETHTQIRRRTKTDKEAGIATLNRSSAVENVLQPEYQWKGGDNEDAPVIAGFGDYVGCFFGIVDGLVMFDGAANWECNWKRGLWKGV